MKFVLAGIVLIAASLFGAALVAPQASAQDGAPALASGEWINGAALPFKGRVTVLHFWTFGCGNCKHNLPYVQKWASKYAPNDVQVIGIHTPELDDEKDPKNVRDAVARYGIKYPVLIDGNSENWNRYAVEAWPTIILIDKKGRIRKTLVGELQWGRKDTFGELSRLIEDLTQEKG